MATLFDCFDGTGTQSFIASGGAITLNLDTTNIDLPSGSASPFSLSSDVLTINETGPFVFHYRVTADWSATTSSSAADGFFMELQADNGSGFALINGSRAHAHPETGSNGAAATASATIAYSVTTGDQFRIRVFANNAVTWETVSNGSGLTAWSDVDTTDGAPDTASYITAESEGDLSDERVATSGEGIAIVNDASGGTATWALNVPGLNAYTAPLSTDYILVYDDTAKEHKKVIISNMLRVQHATSIATAAVAGHGGGGMLGVCLANHAAGMAESDFIGTATVNAKKVLTDFRTNGDWRNLRAVDSDVVDRAVQTLTIWTTWDGAGT